MNPPVPPLRPNYTAEDFKAGQSILLRCDGLTGVPRYMHGDRAVVVKATAKRVLVARVDGGGGSAGSARQLRVTPNQVALILEESQPR